MKIGFWNLRNKNLATEAAQLCTEHKLDVFITAESGLNEFEFITRVNAGASSVLFRVPGLSTKLTFYTRLPVKRVTAIKDEGGISVRTIDPLIGKQIILTAVHLPSKMHKNDTDQLMTSIRLRALIEQAEEFHGHRRTIVIGDFNMNPFEEGVTAADALHAVMNRNTANKGSRVVQGRECHFFYNPMWLRFGDRPSSAQGTYYYSSSHQVCLYWNLFDQLLIRPDLLDCFRDTDLDIITAIGGKSLAKADGTPDMNTYSDHFPLVTTLRIETNLN